MIPEGVLLHHFHTREQDGEEGGDELLMGRNPDCTRVFLGPLQRNDRSTLSGTLIRAKCSPPRRQATSR